MIYLPFASRREGEGIEHGKASRFMDGHRCVLGIGGTILSRENWTGLARK